MPGTRNVDAVHPDAFRAVMGAFPTGVTVVTTIDEHGVPYGYTAGSFCSVSLYPPLVSVCVATSATCFPALAVCTTFAVSVLRPDQVGMARRFSAKGTDKFAGGGLRTSGLGLPVVEEALAVVECVAHGRHLAGDHVILVGEVRSAVRHDGDPLVFHDSSFTRLVSTPVSQ